jgi:hypothetical protein
VETGLLRDSDWEPLDGQPCRVLEFTPLAGRMEGTKVKSSTMGAYASIELESPVLAEPTTGFRSPPLIGSSGRGPVLASCTA